MHILNSDFRCGWLLVLILIWPHAASFAAEKSIDVRELLVVTGVSSQLKLLPDRLHASLSNDPNLARELKPRQIARFEAVMLDAFNPATIEQEIADDLQSQGYHPAVLTSALAIWQSPFMQKMTSLEIQASTVESEAELEAYGRVLQQHPASDVRRRVIGALDDAGQVSQAGTLLQLGIFRVLLKGMARITPPQRRPTDQDIETEILALGRKLEPSVRAETEVELLYTYRHVSDEELEKYLDQLNLSAPQFWIKRINASLVRSFERATQRFLLKLEDTLRNHPELEARAKSVPLTTYSAHS
jgi:hypothetical protein